MKKIPLLLLCIAFAAVAYAQHPIHQYIIHLYPIAGSNAQPMDEVTIKYDDKPMIQTDYTKVTILTDAATLHNLAAFVRANIKSHVASTNPDAASFGVILFAQTALVTRYYLNSRTESRDYFKHLIAVLTAKHADKNVIDELQKILMHID